jgi:hypothetical protein
MNEPNMKFLDFSGNQSYALPDNKISIISNGKGDNRITLNNSMTKLIRDDGYQYLRVGFNDFSSDMYFILCKNQTPDALFLATATKKRTVINSKYLATKMVERMGLKQDSLQHLNVSENLSNSPDYMTFRITK